MTLGKSRLRRKAQRITFDRYRPKITFRVYMTWLHGRFVGANSSSSKSDSYTRRAGLIFPIRTRSVSGTRLTQLERRTQTGQQAYSCLVRLRLHLAQETGEVGVMAVAWTIASPMMSQVSTEE